MTDEEFENQTITCQICNKEIPKDFTFPDNGVQWSPARWKRICSVRCQENGIRLQALFNLRQKLKNAYDIFDYKSFQEVFAFGEDGGYAEKKYELYRQDTYRFMLSLDEKNATKFFLAVLKI